MPLVISKSRSVQYIAGVELLAEILGHSNFDGEDWAIGDRIIFEDGTQSLIKQEPGDLFFTWEEPWPAELEEVKQTMGLTEAMNWKELFAPFEFEFRIEYAQTKEASRFLAVGCAVTLALAAAALVVFVVLVLARDWRGMGQHGSSSENLICSNSS